MSGGGGPDPAGQPASASKPDSHCADEHEWETFPELLLLDPEEDKQQPGKPAAEAGHGTPALSSAAGAGQIALANVGGGASKPAQEPQLAIKRDVLKPLLEACTWDYATAAWQTPATGPDARLIGLDWGNMLKLPPGWTPTNFVPTFFPDEPDANQRDKPRLDIVVSFDNGHSVRYHPSAAPIWSTSPQPTDAMQKRYNRAKRLGGAKTSGSPQ